MIDILLSTYNGEAFLAEQLDSLISQDYQEFNIIIRDDGSSDNTLRIINQYKHSYPNKIRVIDNLNTNLGSTGSFFYLLTFSRAEFVMFCDQDDVWDSDKLQRMQRFYDENVIQKKKPVLIHSQAEVVDDKLKLMRKETELFNYKYGMEKSLCWQIFQNDVTGCTMMINGIMRDLICNAQINPDNIIQHDWFLANIAYLNGTKYYFPEKTIKYRQHSHNVISAKQQSFIKRVMLKIQKGTSFPFYDQVSELLKVYNTIANDKNYLILSEFCSLKQQNKIKRIIWFIKNNFYREGNLFFKIYQLFVC